MLGVEAGNGKDKVIIVNLVEVDVPPKVKAVVKSAVEQCTREVSKAGASAFEAAIDITQWGKANASEGLEETKRAIGVLGSLDLGKLSPAEKTTIADALKKRAGKSDIDKPPAVAGHESYGATASNSNIDAALKLIGVGAILPTDGEAGAYLYLNNETNQVSGFAVSIRWAIGKSK